VRKVWGIAHDGFEVDDPTVDVHAEDGGIASKKSVDVEDEIAVGVEWADFCGDVFEVVSYGLDAS
jgi:hypothetical protein